MLQISCDSYYDPATVHYNVTLTVNISNQHPLAREVLLTHPFIIYAERFTFISIEERIQIRPFAQVRVYKILSDLMFGDCTIIINAGRCH